MQTRIFFVAISYSMLVYVIMFFEYYSLNIPVWDMGHALQTLYNIHNCHGSLTFFISTILYQGDRFLLFFVPTNVNSLILLQALSVGLAIIPLYYITKIKLKDEKLRILTVILFMLYAPLWGNYFFPYHFQSLFTLFFFSMYYFTLKDNKILSIIFSILASLVRFPFVILIVFYSAVELAFRKNVKINKYVLAVSAIILIASYVMSNVCPTIIPGIEKEAKLDATPSYKIPLIDKILTIPTLLLPFSMVPLLSYFIINLVPYTVLIFITCSAGFVFPKLFIFQYSSLYTYAVFIAFIDAISKFRIKEIISIAIILLTFFSFFMFSYVSPFYPYANYPAVFFTPNNARELCYVVNIIPRNATILVQDNMPEFYPRTYLPDNYPLVIGDTELVYSNYSFEHNNYLVVFCLGKFNTSICYVAVDTVNDFFWQSLNMTNLFYSHGYGIYIIYDYIIILKYNYSSPPIINTGYSFVIPGHVSVDLPLIPGIYELNATACVCGRDTRFVIMKDFGFVHISTNSRTEVSLIDVFDLKA